MGLRCRTTCLELGSDIATRSGGHVLDRCLSVQLVGVLVNN